MVAGICSPTLDSKSNFMVRICPSTAWMPRSIKPFDCELPTGDDSWIVLPTPSTWASSGVIFSNFDLADLRAPIIYKRSLRAGSWSDYRTMSAFSKPISFKKVSTRRAGYSREAPFIGTIVVRVIFDDLSFATKMVHIGLPCVLIKQ